MNTAELTCNFLRDEYLVQENEFKKLLWMNCRQLMEQQRLFRAMFTGISDSGHIMVKFSSGHPVPRVNSSSQIILFFSPEHRAKGAVDGSTYIDLLRLKRMHVEGSLVWLHLKDEFFEGGYSFVAEEGPAGERLNSFRNTFVYIGEGKPLLQMLKNLNDYVRANTDNPLLLPWYDLNRGPCSISPLDEGQISPEYLFSLSQSMYPSPMIIQGPPGTGKSFIIAELARELALRNKTVLVTTLANKALIEIAKKEPLTDLLQAGRICKKSMTMDEQKKLPELQALKEVVPVEGDIHLCSYYSASLSALLFNRNLRKYDYVIVDEASQALLPFLAATLSIGEKQIFIGDTRQLSPVVKLTRDKIASRNFDPVVKGLESVSQIIPTCQLTATYRLNPYAAGCTGMFYRYPLLSKNTGSHEIKIRIRGTEFTLMQGNYLITICPGRVDFNEIFYGTVTEIFEQLNEFRPENDRRKKAEIAVISSRVTDCTNLYRKLKLKAKFDDRRVTVDSVHRCQGMTVHFAIYAVTEESVFSFRESSFNVATSRAKIATFIVAPEHMVNDAVMRSDGVGMFLRKLRDDGYELRLSSGTWF